MTVRRILPLLFLMTTVSAIAQTPVPEHFAMLEPLLGRTWRGEFEGSTPEKPVVDIARWELALGGKIVRVLHSINDGSYGGETIIRWDESKGSLVYHYFTTAGFATTGTMRQEEGRIMTHETVAGNVNGITEVTSTYTVTAPGRFESSSSYLKNGEWVGGRKVTYVEAPEARVVLP